MTLWSDFRLTRLGDTYLQAHHVPALTHCCDVIVPCVVIHIPIVRFLCVLALVNLFLVMHFLVAADMASTIVYDTFLAQKPSLK
jgi:hypothetical protein